MLRRTLMSLSAVAAFAGALTLALYAVPSAAAVPVIVEAALQEEFRRPGDASMAGMVPYFEWFCINCHESNDPEQRAPSRAALRSMDPERVLAALTTGPMAEFVPGFDEDQLRAMAELASGTPFGGVADRTADAMSNPCPSPLRLEDPFAQPGWNGWSPDPTRSYRFQPPEAAGLTGAQLADLKLKWAFAFPGAASAAWAQPTVVGGALFIGSDNNFVYALDAKTGCVHWSFEAPGQVRTAVSIGPVEVPGVRYAAMFGDYMGYVSAVNAETGEKLWSMRPDDHPASKMTGPPTLDMSPGGHLYVGVASWEEMPGMALEYGCCKFQGSVVAVDVNTGEKVWATYTFPNPAKRLRTNAAGTELWGPAGAAVWNAPTLDMEQRRVYATAGNCYITEFFEPGEFGYDQEACNAVFAFDMDTGERLWWTQLLATVYDRHGGGCGMTAEQIRINCPGFVNGPDDDPSGAPVLHTLDDGRRILIQGQESGRVTALDPDNEGAILWVAQAGDTMAASNAGFGGGFNGEYYFKPMPFADGSGSISALRAEDGSRAWHTPIPQRTDCEDPESTQTCHSGNWAAASVIEGAVLTGSRDGVMRSFSTEDGSILWEFDTLRDFDTINGVEGFGGASATIVDGMLYMGSGYVILGGAPGNVLLAFGLD